MPISATAAIVVKSAGSAGMPEISDAASLAALAAWRVTQGIYRFDPTVYDEVRRTPVSGDIPHQILYRLPDWCVYVETPGMDYGAEPMHGFFAHLEHDDQTRLPELRLLLDLGTGFVPIPLPLGAWSLAESLQRMLERGRANVAGLDIGPVPDLPDAARQRFAEPLPELLSLLLYLCSQAAELGDRSRHAGRPTPKRMGAMLRYLAPERSTVWPVAVRLGAALRAAWADSAQGSAGEGRMGVRPHVRRCHWHGFWIGPRDGERQFDVRWLPNIPVNVRDVAELPAVVRPVA